MMEELNFRVRKKGPDSNTNKTGQIFYVKSKNTSEYLPVVKFPPFFNWWIKIGYYGLCIPFKPVLDTPGRYQLQSNKFQKVISF